MDTSAIAVVKAGKEYAAGKVGGVYPNPVESDTILDLASFETSEHKATHVYITLANKYDSGYCGEEWLYLPATLPYNKSEEDFNDTMGCMNESVIGGVLGICYRANERYLHKSLYNKSAESVSELILQMAKDGIKGTVHVVFRSYPNGHKCYPEEVRNFNIIL
jgi:hypothetical protein